MLFFKRSSKKELPKTDLELVRLYRQSGDLAHLGELYERYTHLVYGICLKYLKDREESKDAVMQIFEKLITDLKTHEVENFKSWLHVLSKNYCLMIIRSSKYAIGIGFFENTGETDMENTHSLHHTEYEAGDDGKEMSLQVMEQGITELPAEQKRCIEMFFFEHKSYKEICDTTGFDINKVKSYIQNGKRNLKIYIEKNTS